MLGTRKNSEEIDAVQPKRHVGTIDAQVAEDDRAEGPN
jgi:hypothetical protein